jgi:transposase
MPANLLLELPDVDIDTVARTSTGIEIVARSRTQTGVCPDCQHPSHSLHSRYGREPQDLPCFGEPVRLKLTVSRFRCRNPECRRQTFVERLPNLVAFYARCTRRLVTVLQLTTIESGAETGARIVKAFGINVGGDTLLRLLRRIVLPQVWNVQKIGIDDWAFKKGLRYGTLLIDLERRHPIDVLPDRQGETVKNWLTQHPGIELVTRDRSRDYARAISAGAPQALQVADRWHLLKNLTEALQKALDKYAKQLGRWTVDEQSPSPVLAADHAPRLSAAKHASQQLRHTARQERFEQVHHLHRLGWRQRQIAHHLGLCTRTVRRYLAQDTLLHTHRCHTSKLDPHKGYLLRRWNEGCSMNFVRKDTREAKPLCGIISQRCVMRRKTGYTMGRRS